jgi:hypothetical protein
MTTALGSVDKRDAASLAVLHRGGLLTAVWVPDEAHEAMRDQIPRPTGGSTSGARSTPAAECVSVTSRADLFGRPRGLDEGASRLAGLSELR